MSHYPLSLLRDLLRPVQQRKGVVIGLSATSAQIATASGIESATPAEGITVGGAVILREGVAHPIATPSKTYAL